MYLSHSHVSLCIVRGFCKLPALSCIWAKGGGVCICILGEVAMMSLSQLHSYVCKVRRGIESQGRIDHLSHDCRALWFSSNLFCMACWHVCCDIMCDEK